MLLWSSLVAFLGSAAAFFGFASDHIVGPLAALALVLSAFVTICATEVER